MHYLILALTILCPLALASTEYTNVQYHSCHDGDTCRFVIDGKVQNVRFQGIDTPELKQPLGHEAKQTTIKLISKGNITLTCYGSAMGNRMGCDVFNNGLNVNNELVRTGMAYEYRRYSKGKYTKAQEYAKRHKLGVWGIDTLSPYCYRNDNARCEGNKRFMP